MREVLAVIYAERVIRISCHYGDRPRLAIQSPSDRDRDEIRQIELAAGATGTDLIQRQPGPSGVQCHQPGVDLGRTDSHRGVGVAPLDDLHRSLIAVAPDTTVAGRVL